MIIVGLTGSIGMGKSATADMFAAQGIPVFDSDKTVHQLQAKDGDAIPAIEMAFPDVVKDGCLDRQALGAKVFGNPDALKLLESIMHPMVGEARKDFFDKAINEEAPFVVLDIPLLFETGGGQSCDKIIVVHAPADVQRDRVLAREGMTKEKFEQILAKQIPSDEKASKADYVIETDKGFKAAQDQVAAIIQELKDHA